MKEPLVTKAMKCDIVSSGVFVEADLRWRRILARDRAADGHFWSSVASTGVYCRPSCPSRSANPKNVGLHDTLAEAQTIDFRPCKCSNPQGPSWEAENAAIATRVCRLIEQGEEVPSPTELAEAVQRSPGYFHRLFKTQTGLTPKDYANGQRAARVRDGLAKDRSAAEAISEGGFNSSGRFYEQSTDMLGMTPTRHKAGVGKKRSVCDRRVLGRCDPCGLQRKRSRVDPHR
jgi:AraC family transcriptional regulator of adaptative response/methylated-DNA-[protein]-cysteine methyltransferase